MQLGAPAPTAAPAAQPPGQQHEAPSLGKRVLRLFLYQRELTPILITIGLFLYNVSGGLMKPTNTDTGLGIVVQSNVGPYLAKNRFSGTSSKQQTLKPPSSVPH